jgi:hypothetical protein
MLRLDGTVYAGGRERRKLAVVWTYIQQGHVAVVQAPRTLLIY